MIRTVAKSAFAGVLLAALAAGCTSGNSAIQPPFTSVNISQIGKLQFAVGTANLQMPPPSSGGSGGTFVGLNTVVTFRKADGTSAFAVNTPKITGPAGFVVPNSAFAGSDGGTNTITGSPQTPTSTNTTFGQQGQATLYGFGPNNYGVSGSAPFGNYDLPFYADVLPGFSSSNTYPETAFYGVPPAFPQGQVSGFSGFNPGFVDFAAKPVSGSYNLAVTVPTSPGSSQPSFTYNTAASMSASRVLPVFSGITFSPTAAGGATIAVTLPAGATEAYMQVSDLSSGAMYGLEYPHSGSQTLPGGSFAGCDVVALVGVAFDYPALEAAEPMNVSQTPNIKGSHNQDDISVNFPIEAQIAASGGGSCSSSLRIRHHQRHWR
jgi:hypothetical protein